MRDVSILNIEEEKPDLLGELEDMFDDLSIDGPDSSQMYQMYGVFLKDIVRNPIVINGISLTFNRNISKHPICSGKFEAFEHIITRDNKYNGKRQFDRERANKIHWIRPIIENVSDARIKYFEKINDKGFNQQFYWFESKNFIVILRELNPKLLLITTYFVDKWKKEEYKTWFNEYRQKKTPLRK